MTTFTDPHESRALARLHPLRAVPGRPRKPHTLVEVPVLAPPGNRDRHTLRTVAATPDVAADVDATEHRARLTVAHRLAHDPAGALEVLQALGLADDDGRAASVGRVGELTHGIRD